MDMRIEVGLPPDEHGFTGRECSHCKKYFKVKFGTGLHTPICNCPYCGFRGNHNEFDTEDQIEYAKSIALRKVMEEMIEPMLQELEHSFKELERATRSGFIQIKVDTQCSPIIVPLNRYQEKEVETYVKCDHCSLEFAVYGVFANCPDCNTLNASIVFRKSIEVAHKRISLLKSTEKDPELQNAIMEDALSSGVSSFDALGKALQQHYPKIFPETPKNLFQNIEALSKSMSKSVDKSVSDIIGREDFGFLLKMFQVRHVYEDNMGVIDDDFIRKIPYLAHLRGRKYQLRQEEIEKFLNAILETGNKILEILESIK